MAEKKYSLREDYSIADIEKIYHNTVLNQDFYSATYGTNWSLQPYEEMAQLLKAILSPKRHLVNNGTPQWKLDMELNRPFRNIVLENDLPHLGHITLASYRWWTEFFLTQLQRLHTKYQ